MNSKGKSGQNPSGRPSSLLEAKGPGVEKLLNGKFSEWTGALVKQTFLEQAERQRKAANGVLVEWHFAEAGAARAMASAFEDAGLLGPIKVIYTPLKPMGEAQR